MPLLHVAFFLSSCAAGDPIPAKAVWSAKTDLNADTQPRRVFITPDKHDLVLLRKISFAEGEKRLEPITIPLVNGVIPTVRVTVSPPRDILKADRFRYEYDLSNGTNARDPIYLFFVVLPNLSAGIDPGYSGVGGYGASMGSSQTSTQRELDDRQQAREAFWFAGNIQPGAMQKGFYVESFQMPGFTTAGLGGGFIGIPDGATDQEARELEELGVWDDDVDITTLTFGPMFQRGTEPAEVLKNYRVGVAKLRSCRSIPHSAAFLPEIARILNEPGIESKLEASLDGMNAKPVTPVELELMNCLRLIARAFANR
jgi:hypothetical protein